MIDLTAFDLVILDADGTCCRREDGSLLPGVAEFIDGLADLDHRPRLAIASNQGGVGVRVMGGFGKPEKYPTEQQALTQYGELAERLGATLYLCFAYVDWNGNWSPEPVGTDFPDFYRREWRKPEGGMLLRAMEDAGVLPARTLMVGDRPEDEAAAAAAGCSFMVAHSFFGRLEGKNEN